MMQNIPKTLQGPWALSRARRSLFLALLFLPLGVAAPASWAQEEPEFSDLRILTEINGTDSDAGLQIFVDGDDWVNLQVRDPDGRKIYDVRAGSGTAEQGLTENYFESAEPSCLEDPLVDFLDRFPEGEYEFIAKTTDNAFLEGEAFLSHDFPAIPDNLAAVDTGAVTVQWSWPGAVGPSDLGDDCDHMGLATTLTDPNDLFGFQVIVIREEPEPALELAVELGPSASQLALPPGFVQNDALYKWEVIAIGKGVDPENPGVLDAAFKGNQTIAEDTFCIDGAGVLGACPE